MSKDKTYTATSVAVTTDSSIDIRPVNDIEINSRFLGHLDKLVSDATISAKPERVINYPFRFKVEDKASFLKLKKKLKSLNIKFSEVFREQYPVFLKAISKK